MIAQHKNVYGKITAEKKNENCGQRQQITEPRRCWWLLIVECWKLKKSQRWIDSKQNKKNKSATFWEILRKTIKQNDENNNKKSKKKMNKIIRTKCVETWGTKTRDSLASLRSQLRLFWLNDHYIEKYHNTPMTLPGQLSYGSVGRAVQSLIALRLHTNYNYDDLRGDNIIYI